MITRENRFFQLALAAQLLLAACSSGDGLSGARGDTSTVSAGSGASGTASGSASDEAAGAPDAPVWVMLTSLDCSWNALVAPAKVAVDCRLKGQDATEGERATIVSTWSVDPGDGATATTTGDFAVRVEVRTQALAGSRLALTLTRAGVALLDRTETFPKLLPALADASLASCLSTATDAGPCFAAAGVAMTGVSTAPPSTTAVTTVPPPAALSDGPPPAFVAASAWRGSYQEDDGVCTLRNPGTDGCTCPSGSSPTVLDAPLDEEGKYSATRSSRFTVCLTSEPHDEMLGGFYQKLASAIITTCSVANPLTGDCTCPAKTNTATVAQFRGPLMSLYPGAVADAVMTLTACVEPDLAPRGYAGMYQTDGQLNCLQTNVYGGACACPDGSSRQLARQFKATTGLACGVTPCELYTFVCMTK